MLFKSLELRRLRRKIHLAWSKFDWKEECIRLHTSYCVKSIMWTICKCLIKCRWVIHRVPEHGKKSTLYLFQNDVALYFEPFWERGNVADINFWCFIKFNGKKTEILRLTRSNVVILKRRTRDSSWQWNVAGTPNRLE